MTDFFVGAGEVRISSARAGNSKWVLVQRPDGFIDLFTSGGKFMSRLDRAVRSDTQPVFDYRDDDHVFTVDGNKVWRNNLLTDEAELVMSFPEYVSLSAPHAEGDLQESGHLALCGIRPDGAEEVFDADVLHATGGPVYPQSEPFDGIKAAGNHLILSKKSGIYDLTSNTQLTAANGHAAAGLWNGSPYICWCTSAHPTLNRNAVELVEIANPSNRRILAEFDKAKIAMHLSMGDGCCFASVFSPDLSMPWQIIRLGFDGSRELLFEWLPTSYNALYQPRASYGSGYVFFNRWDGQKCQVYGIKLTENVATAALTTAEPMIDYSSYIGKEFVIKPQSECPTCHSTIAGIFERKAAT